MQIQQTNNKKTQQQSTKKCNKQAIKHNAHICTTRVLRVKHKTIFTWLSITL